MGGNVHNHDWCRVVLIDDKVGRRPRELPPTGIQASMEHQSNALACSGGWELVRARPHTSEADALPYADLLRNPRRPTPASHAATSVTDGVSSGNPLATPLEAVDGGVLLEVTGNARYAAQSERTLDQTESRAQSWSATRIATAALAHL